MSKPGFFRPSLHFFLICFVLVTGSAATTVVLIVGEARLSGFERSTLESIVKRRANATGLIFARALWVDWQDVENLATTVVTIPSSETRAKLDLVVAQGDRISWAGIAALDGTVITSSAGMLEGQSVLERPWFQRGLEGPFAGDVHDAKLLASLIPLIDGEPARFLDLAAPILNSSGSAVGVVGFHINYAWASACLAETAEYIGVEAVIVDRDGKIVIGRDGLAGEQFSIASFGAARAGADASFVETWPDGVRSLSIVIPAIGYRDLPSFGWSLIARVDANSLSSASQGISRSALLLLLGVAIALIAATYAFSRYFLSPLDRIARTAEEIANGEDVYPEESRRSSELARLSSAIARLQARLGKPSA